MPLSELFVEVFCAPPWNEEWNANLAYERLVLIFRSYEFCGFLAIEEQTPVGAIFSRLMSFKGEKELEIIEMYVSPSNQRNGVGSQLIRRAERYARENDIKNLVLLTDKNTYAKVFYSKVGFSPYPENLLMGKGIQS